MRCGVWQVGPASRAPGASPHQDFSARSASDERHHQEDSHRHCQHHAHDPIYNPIWGHAATAGRLPGWTSGPTRAEELYERAVFGGDGDALAGADRELVGLAYLSDDPGAKHAYLDEAAELARSVGAAGVLKWVDDARQ